MGKWSEHLCSQFHLVLPEDTARWYDEEMWRRQAESRYGRPISPEEILESPSSAICGGLMLPDTLPILGNGFGDVLAMRFGFDGALTEFVEWSHEGGEWHPCGNSLVDTLFYDATRTSWAAEHEEREPADDEVFRFAEWAFRGQPSSFPGASFQEFLGQHDEDEQPIAALLSHGVAESAVRRDLARAALTNGLSRSCGQMGGQDIAQAAGITWEQLAKWLPDASVMPQEMKVRLAEVTNLTINELVAQDVDAAAAAADAVLRKRDDLQWPYAVVGWIAEKRGRQEDALKAYSRGLQALSSTADFTERWTPMGPDRPMDFCVARLRALAKDAPDSVDDNAHLAAALILPSQREPPGSFPVREYWLERAAEHRRAGEYREAYRACYAAACDDPCFDDMDMILEELAATADSAGAPALAKIAKHHLATMDTDPTTFPAGEMAPQKKPWWRFW